MRLCVSVCIFHRAFTEQFKVSVHSQVRNMPIKVIKWCLVFTYYIFSHSGAVESYEFLSCPLLFGQLNQL